MPSPKIKKNAQDLNASQDPENCIILILARIKGYKTHLEQEQHQIPVPQAFLEYNEINAHTSKETSYLDECAAIDHKIAVADRWISLLESTPPQIEAFRTDFTKVEVQDILTEHRDSIVKRLFIGIKELLKALYSSDSMVYQKSFIQHSNYIFFWKTQGQLLLEAIAIAIAIAIGKTQLDNSNEESKPNLSVNLQ